MGTMTEIDRRTRRAQSHSFAGAAALVLAVGAFPVFGWLASIAMLLLGVGNLLAARGVKADGAVPLPAKVLMGAGGLGFAAVVVILVVRAVTG